MSWKWWPVNYQHAPTQVAQHLKTHSYYNSATGYNQLPPTQADLSQMADSHVHHLTDLDYIHQLQALGGIIKMIKCSCVAITIL